MFRALGAVRANVISPQVASALAEQGEDETGRLLWEISRAGLIDLTDRGAQLHELIHRFAVSKLNERPDERVLVHARLSAWLVASAADAATHLGDLGRPHA